LLLQRPERRPLALTQLPRQVPGRRLAQLPGRISQLGRAVMRQRQRRHHQPTFWIPSDDAASNAAENVAAPSTVASEEKSANTVPKKYWVVVSELGYMYNLRASPSTAAVYVCAV